MRHVPVTIDRVAMKSAADMIVHSAGGHFAQREEIHFKRVLTVLTLRIAGVEARQKIQCDRPRKFRCGAKPTFARIKTTIELAVSVFEDRDVDLGGGFGLRGL